MKITERWKIFFRLRKGRCPACNSDAPYVYSCKICRKYNGCVPSKKIKELWRQRYLAEKCPHGWPKDDECLECRPRLSRAEMFNRKQNWRSG